MTSKISKEILVVSYIYLNDLDVDVGSTVGTFAIKMKINGVLDNKESVGL